MSGRGIPSHKQHLSVYDPMLSVHFDIYEYNRSTLVDVSVSISTSTIVLIFPILGHEMDVQDYT